MTQIRDVSFSVCVPSRGCARACVFVNACVCEHLYVWQAHVCMPTCEYAHVPEDHVCMQVAYFSTRLFAFNIHVYECIQVTRGVYGMYIHTHAHMNVRMILQVIHNAHHMEHRTRLCP